LTADYAYDSILFHDELRAGTRTELGRKWGPCGHRPVAPVKIGYENTYLYLTLCPFTGAGFAAFLPQLNSHFFGWFVQKIQEYLPQKSLFIADGATAHKAELFDNERLVFERLPAACPELNPVERFFKEVRRRLKCRVFATLDQAQRCVERVVEELFENSGKMVSLTCFSYISEITKNTTP
jgi:transposase